ncbi:MAG: glycosyltransferase [Chloroflexi bacterium]|nr:glycosyltransferase [Chloroflexota bacterium]
MDLQRISIVIPTHNRRDMLLEMLHSLCQQTYPLDLLEVIVVMDGCVDGTAEMLEGLSMPYAVRPVSQAQGGAAAARNHGARLATGDLLLFLDDDLLPCAPLVEEHARLHRGDVHAVVLGRFIPVKGTAGKGGWNIWEERVLEKHYGKMLVGERPAAGRRLYSGNFSVACSLFLEAGGFDERLKRGEDVELGFRLQAAGLPFYYNHNAVAVHRGYRSFLSWCSSAYVYGRCDVLLAKEKRHNVLPEIFQWYERQAAPVRMVLELSLDRPRLRSVFMGGLHWGSSLWTALRLHALAHLGYSAIYKLQYWQGAADELGGRSTFLRAVQRGLLPGFPEKVGPVPEDGRFAPTRAPTGLGGSIKEPLEDNLRSE